ncbi:HD domain-containing protein [Salipaludibacillus sp. LMS25]|uniref:HD domain-containing protein n=1 Tax=Salipaludibacillus sp. LMS25 TaxID=2924031 RepID=UPI0020D0D453|nr:HD domain-containing protein [Salipaludibacillus sp. LMS25]UTR17032.1 HD domain-containing protein [Salipaludibacillus sp. LMS25]
MIVTDPLYGSFNVDKVLANMIESEPVQRLKGIHQGGASYLVNRDWNVTRYEHSLGTMLLVKYLGGSLEEQIAALLHDVSHTAFSHVIDAVFEHDQEDYHEKIYAQVIEKSDLPIILSQHGYDYKELLFDHGQWQLLEQPAPTLCADRVDYTLRDMYTYGHVKKEDVTKFIADLTVVEGEIAVKTVSSAEWFVSTYFKEVIGFFMHPLNVYGYETLAVLLKTALTANILTEDDFLDDDARVMAKLTASSNVDIQTQLSRLHRHVTVVEDGDDYTFYRKNKVRLIDPLVYTDGRLKPVSHLSEKAKSMINQTKEKALAGSYVKVIAY